MTLTSVDNTERLFQTKPISPVDIFSTTLAKLPDPADHEGALVYVPGTGLLLSDGTAWGAVGGTAAAGPNLSTVPSEAVYQQFAISLKNNGGVLQHKFGPLPIPNMTSFPTETGAGCLSAIRNAAATSYVTTVSGPDASTGLSDGAKIQNGGSGSGPNLYLDTDDPVDLYNTVGMQASMLWNDTGNSVIAQAFFNTSVINGVSKFRLTLLFRHPDTGANFNLTTTNIPSGKEIRVGLVGFMGPLTS